MPATALMPAMALMFAAAPEVAVTVATSAPAVAVVTRAAAEAAAVPVWKCPP
jgi:hypothetical protein